jgi:Raf kinase inhibitor-like YbhB/YbcL family protein
MSPKSLWLSLVLLTPLIASAQPSTNAVVVAPVIPSLKVTSTAFQDGARMPIPYTCNGLNISPPIAWTGAPGGTESFALICDDPDAGYGKVFAHWVVYNIPKDTTSLPEKMPTDIQLQNGTIQGLNDFKKLGYRGPCPPMGVHRYVFKVYALNTTLLVLGTIDKAKLEDAMKGHILAQGQIIGTFKR